MGARCSATLRSARIRARSARSITASAASTIVPSGREASLASSSWSIRPSRWRLPSRARGVSARLPTCPTRRREPRRRPQSAGPDHRLFSVLPLDRHGFLPDLETALIDREVAEDRLGLERQQRVAEPFGLSGAGLSHRLGKNLAARIGVGRLNRGGAVEFFLVRRYEFLIAGIWQARIPERRAVDKFSVLSELLVKFRKQAVRQAAHHAGIEVHRLHLSDNRHEVVEPDGR